MTVAANIGVYAATAIGLNIVVGLAGLLDLGYVAFLGIGAFVAANLSGAAASHVGIQLPFPLVMVICAVVAGSSARSSARRRCGCAATTSRS